MTSHYPNMKILALATAMLLSGCKNNHQEAEAAVQPTAIKKCKKPDWKGSGECRPGACGGNSPILNSFPISGVRPDGECNPTEGVQMVPDSIVGPNNAGPCHGATLDLDENQLVGRDGKAGKVLCKGKELEGTTFLLRNFDSKEARIKIDKVEDYYFPGTNERRVAYRMVSTKYATESLCAPVAAKKFRTQLDIELSDWNKYIDDTAPVTSLLVVPIRSELYFLEGKPVEIETDWESHQRDWIHFACVEDVLAKRSFYGLYTDNVERSRAALRMLTANYCGELPVTKRGLKVDWEGVENQTLEASWTSQGAACVSDARLLYSDGETQQIPSKPPSWVKYCTTTPCSKPSDWLDQARACEEHDAAGKVIRTWTIPGCTPCPAGGCKPRELRSFVVTKQ